MERSLTPTSYLVLGLVRLREPCTSYDLKSLVNVSIGHFWSFPHSQLYAEPARLVEEGLLTETQEETGRRRRLYQITPAGLDVLEGWYDEHDSDVGEIRDLGLLKLFFASTTGAEQVRALAEHQSRVHRNRMESLLALREEVRERADAAQLATLELGLRWDRVASQFWDEVAADPPVADPPVSEPGGGGT